MVTMRGWRSLLVLGLLAHGLDAAAQRVTNVTAEQQGQALVIGYALDADGPVEVQLFLSTDRGRTWEGPLANCTGDLGKGVKPGTDKRIRWEVLQERELVSDGVQFKVVVKRGVPTKTADLKPWLNPDLTYGSVTDIDGNTYATIKIGEQEWMAENLRTTRFSNGDRISSITKNKQWSMITNGAYCYSNNSIKNGHRYGNLYNFYAAHDYRNICPHGWHVPSDDEWKQLELYLGMPLNEVDMNKWRGASNYIGSKMKTSSMWKALLSIGTNSSGFSGLPSGGRGKDGKFYNLVETLGYWWSASPNGENSAWYRSLSHDHTGIYRYYGEMMYGFCVRCVKD